VPLRYVLAHSASDFLKGNCVGGAQDNVPQIFNLVGLEGVILKVMLSERSALGSSGSTGKR
jgi:hypothetical protein